MTETTARRIERLLLRLLAVLDPEKKTAPKSAATVSSVTSAFGTVTDHGDSTDLPRQVVNETRKVGPMGKARRVTMIKGHV